MNSTEFARTVAAVVADLPAGHVSAWAAVLDRADRPGRRVEAALIDARGGYALAGHARRLVEAWQAQGAELAGAAVGLALRSAAIVRQDADAHRSEVVISGPTSDSVPVRLTSTVVIEIIRAARHSLLVVSFAAYGVAEVITELAAAADRGIHIDLVLESTANDGGTLHGATGAAAAFARLRGNATFWHWPAHRRPAAASSRAALHAKLIAADSTIALVSSANLTDRALAHNIEVGIILRSPDVVARITRHFKALMDPDIGPLQPLPSDSH